ncbi:MAG: translation initiation factor IF-2 [Acidobacteria bacterium]|nr:translation initiation factor IF-2 [Acidobacteriota bacterium]
MSTIRIYKVAEVLGIPSQEVMDLLRTAHGIEVKSASSTIEEIVARQFAQRIARERNLDLPGGNPFVQKPLSRRGGKRGGPRAEPPPPARPKLGPPRLVKAAKAARAAAAEAEAAASQNGETAVAAAVEPAAVQPDSLPAPTPTGGGAPVEPAAPAPPPVPPPAPRRLPMPTVRVETEPPARTPRPARPAASVQPVVRTEPSPPVPAPVQPPQAEPARAAKAEPSLAATVEPASAAPAEAASTATAEPPGPVAPPAMPPAPPPAAPVQAVTAPAAPVQAVTAPAAPSVPAASSRPAPAAAGTAPRPSPAAAPPVAPPSARAAAPAVRSAANLTPRPTGRVVPPKLRLRVEEPRRAVKPPTPRPAPPRPGVTPPGARVPVAARTTVQTPLGGPRPLPSQPVRPPSARPLPPRPAVGYRPPPRPHHRPGGRRSAYRRTRAQARTPAAPPPPPPITRTITLAEGMTVKDLADKLEVRAKDVLKKLIEKRMMMTINTTLDAETATTIAREFGADVKMRSFEEEMVIVESEVAKPEDLVARVPVVTVMGHVDHGKTTLLDAIRETNVAGGEAGGITQHIGAYSVSIDDRRIVFLDTPGHEAFTLMRARGARVTDVVVLVVAADDGVMPQTQEAIDHARAADVPIIVALNKIDKADANPERVKQELAARELTPEDWGGSTVVVPVSAKKGENLDSLLEMILLVTEMGEHKANPVRAATGTVLEAKVDRGRGPVATILIQDGTLRVGDNFIAGVQVGRVRALIDDRLQQTREAGPSSPVEVLGLTGLPQPGDAFQAVADAAKARQIALLRQNQAKERALGGRGQRLTLESLQAQLTEGEVKELPVIIKADVQGSAEVLADSLSKLGDDRVRINVIHTGVGAISEWDVLLASTSNAIIIGFNIRPDRNASAVAEREGVDIRQHSVIYNVTDEIKLAMAGLLEPTIKEQRLGQAEVRDTFKVPKFGTAAGCIVVEGVLTRAGESQARIVRDGVVVHEGRIGSLRRFKDDVNEVKSGLECGVAFERFADIKVGDVIEIFTVERVAATV